MNTAFEVIVIILSSMLALFLIISIVAVSMVLKLIKSLREVVARGEHLIDNAEAIGETFRRNAGAVSLIKVLMSFVNTINKIKK